MGSEPRGRTTGRFLLDYREILLPVYFVPSSSSESGPLGNQLVQATSARTSWCGEAAGISRKRRTHRIGASGNALGEGEINDDEELRGTAARHQRWWQEYRAYGELEEMP